jgi:hypothetical protein
VAARDPEIEVIARELAGRCLDDVRYYSLPYGMTDKPTWDRDVAHVAGYGIDLVTAKGATGITRAAYGNSGYGLQLSRSPLLARLTRAEFCSAAGSSRGTQPSGWQSPSPAPSRRPAPVRQLCLR